MEDDDCHTRLDLGLSIMGHHSSHDAPAAAGKQPIISNRNFFHDDRKKKTSRKTKKTSSSGTCLDLSFKLFPRDDDDEDEIAVNENDDNNNEVVELMTKSSSSIDYIEEPYKSRGRKLDDNKEVAGGGGRKKLRLSKEQSSLLENRFKLQTTLNTAQKQALAEQLKLSPRQVEVWFQNRRARTKLKQTEVDCEFLKKCCESLSNENARLKIELHELRYGRNESSSCGTHALMMCQSCHQKRNVSSTGTCSSNSSGQPYHHNDV